MSGQELERREPEAAVVRAVPIPRQLQEIGVRLGRDESGLAVVYLPDELRQVVNVVNPVSSYAQADPNWTPSISVVTIDESQTYPLPGGKKGLSKQALEALAKAAGVLYTRTARVPKDELSEGELWAYRATVGFRRSDGTIDELTRERGFNAEAERAEIAEAVAKKYSGDAAEAEIHKRWLAELRFGPAKTESKAINRALRAGLGVPTSVDAPALRKPWLVIGFNFTPNYDDPEIKRALVAVALNAQAAIYGGERSDQMPELEAGDIPAEAVTAEERPPDGGAASDDAPAGGQAAGPEAAPEPAAPRSDDEPEPELGGPDRESADRTAEPTLKVPKRVVDAAGKVIATGDTTIAEAVAGAVGGREDSRNWVRWALRNLSEDDERFQNLRLFLEQREPALWEELVAEAVKR